MINVPFAIDRHTLEIDNNRDALKILVETFYGHAWLDFLLENAKSITHKSIYRNDSMMYDVDFQFHLEPEIETMYRLKFH